MQNTQDPYVDSRIPKSPTWIGINDAQDARSFLRGTGYKRGKRLNQWDADPKNRLPITGDLPVDTTPQNSWEQKNGVPKAQDKFSVYRYNSTFMEVVSQWHYAQSAGMMMSSLAFYVPLVMIVAFGYAGVDTYLRGVYDFVTSFLFVLFVWAGGFVVIWFGWNIVGVNLFFTLKRNPIRLNRKTKELYFMYQKRRDGRRKELGDHVITVPWQPNTEDAFFCLSRFDYRNSVQGSVGRLAENYFIAHYKLDERRKVVQDVYLSGNWNFSDIARKIPQQWNFWCKYMNEDLSTLPKVKVYVKVEQDFWEIVKEEYYMLGAGLFVKIMLPLNMMGALAQYIAAKTCVDPIWPPEIEEKCRIDSYDPHIHPKADEEPGWTAALRRDDRA